ncbi:AGE family epimerase/isomerase [Pontibacter korlensis]|uniref:N-acylglucosamine 2-epimerase n=1 Tax=Pontibacter korlensis TaxID=400092 RepID=A0A0E3ZHC4_9BACT|nr:AGE family epimerase/isomerase [Pontibacter korlensis]AKD05375.1 N-acylglucosamine 2-epimerase [Pontibacter korlensis]
MKSKELASYIDLYRGSLLNDVIPFWVEHSLDKEFGGYFTCLDRKGDVFDTDKFMWLQGRQVWMFSSLYDKVEKRQEWLDIAVHGAEFLIEHGRDAEGNWYFSLDRQGKPLMQPYNIFSDCFAALGFSALYKVKPEEVYADIARSTFENILKRRGNPKGKYNKVFPGSRPLKNFSLPMILCNLSLEMEHLLDKEVANTLVQEVVHEVMEVFYQPDTGLIMENVYPDGNVSDSFEGRVVNPGHILEAMWFIMDQAVRLDDQALISRTVEVAMRALDYGWDKQLGGILYFKDVKGFPPQQLEWDQKLWWVHIEALVCLLKGYQHTGDERCWEWFQRVHEYTWTRFPDPGYGEWFGYLNRQGEPLLSLKGGKWKGCFHVPRGLYQCWKALEAIAEKHESLTLQEK